MIIDLLLLLRAQAPSPTSPTTPTPTTTTTPATTTNSTNSTLAPTPRPIVYILLELLCAVLVDSPQNARTFEKLSGLEAVVRVLKGSAVAKDVRWVRFALPDAKSSGKKIGRGVHSVGCGVQVPVRDASGRITACCVWCGTEPWMCATDPVGGWRCVSCAVPNLLTLADPPAA